MKINEIISMTGDAITWNAYSNHTFLRQYANKSLDFIKQVGDYYLYVGGDKYLKCFYVTTEKLDFTVYSTSKSLIGKLEVTLMPAFDGWYKVNISNVKTEYIGKGIGIMLYDCAILQANLTLVSDVTQTPSSQNIWKYFSNHPEKYKVGMFNTRTKEFETLCYNQNKKQYDRDTEDKLFSSYDLVLVVSKAC